jgi:hypothetical protein
MLDEESLAEKLAACSSPSEFSEENEAAGMDVGVNDGHWRDSAHRMWRKLNEELAVRGDMVAKHRKDLEIDFASQVDSIQREVCAHTDR